MAALLMPDPSAATGTAASTTSSSPQGSAITLGDSTADSATVTGDGVSGTPTGTVAFFVCGPLTTASGCATGGQAVGAAVPLDGSSATATSPAFTPSASGTWCFRADYSGDNTYAPSSDGSSGECFTVAQAPTSSLSAPQTSALALGDTNGDSVTITGNGAGGSPTGTVSFFVCGPLGEASGCASGGIAVGSSTPVIASSPGAASAVSPAFAPSSPGFWCFRAEYSGDGNYSPSADGSSGECFGVGKATASVVSTPAGETATLAAGEPDQVTVTGSAGAGSPSGSVSFFVCGPLATTAGCSAGGTAVGTPVPLSAVGGDVATATSAAFTPTGAGIWCFRAEYSGDGNYNPGGDGSPRECFTALQPGAPSATISSPSHNPVYRAGQLVYASYGCTEASGGPGLSSCTGTVPNGAQLNTSTLGPRTFRVTAVSRDGMSTAVFAGYTVAAAPSAWIRSPKDKASYTLGQGIGLNYGCAEGSFGPGLASCLAPAAARTNRRGVFAFVVSATSLDGQTAVRAVHYRVVVPSNRVRLSHLRGHRDGRVTFQLVLPGGGTVDIRETAPRRALPRPKPGSLLFAHLHLRRRGAVRLHLDIPPSRLGKYLQTHHRFTFRVRLTVTFVPINGTPRRASFSGLRVTP